MAPLIVRTISRYLLRQHFAPLGFALAVLTSLMLIQQVAKQLSGLLGKGLPAGAIAASFVASLPLILAVAVSPAHFAPRMTLFHVLAGGHLMMAQASRGG